MDDPARKLTPANENPWYVLMTLYGEQEGEEIDWELHEKNRSVWNYWMTTNNSDPAILDYFGWKEVKLRPHSEPGGYGHGKLRDALRREMARRNPDGDFDRVELPPRLEVVEMDDLDIQNHLVLTEMVFSGPLDLSSSHCHGCLVGANSLFQKRVGLDNLVVSEFLGFSGARFERDVNLVEAELAGIDLANATLSGDAMFDGVTIRGHAEFERCIFVQGASFELARFGVKGPDSKTVPKVTFRECQFGGGLNFDKANFHATFPDFTGVVLPESAVFSAFPKGWPSGALDDPHQAKASCSAIRHVLGKQGLPEDEHFFFRREMGFAGQIGPWWQRLPYRLFGLLSEYGHSIWRPVVSLGLVWLVPALAYLLAWTWQDVSQDGQFGSLRAFGFSFANTFKVFGFQRLYFDWNDIRAMAGWIQVLSAVQTILGVACLFFLGLGLRTRFRLR